MRNIIKQEKEINNMKKTGNVGVTTKWTVDMAIESINAIKKDMIKSGNDISSIVYAIRDELEERNACRDFSIAVGMSKASISKMVTAEKLRADYAISSDVSYNTIYKVKDLFDIDNDTIMATRDLLNQLKSADVIRKLLWKPEDATALNDNDLAYCEADLSALTESSTEDTAEDTAEDKNIIRLANEAKEIKSQVFDILSNYDISKEDMKLIKMLIQSLR